MRRWIKSGALPATKPGKEFRIRETDLQEFLKAHEPRPKAPDRSQFEPSFNDVLAEERREDYSSGQRILTWLGALESTAAQWEGFITDRLYYLETLDLERLLDMDRMTTNVITTYAQQARELKRAAAPELRESLKQAEHRLFKATYEFWAKVEETLGRQQVSDLAQRRAEVQARKAERDAQRAVVEQAAG